MPFLLFFFYTKCVIIIFFMCTEDACRKKLKTLKDRMRSVCASLPKTTSGQPAFDQTTHIRWQFYDAMLYMKDCFIGRDLKSSLVNEEGEPTDTQTQTVNTSETFEGIV